MAKQNDPHLEDLFFGGHTVTLSYPGNPDVDIFMMRPDVMQQRDIVRRARGAKARTKSELLDEQSDERLALLLEYESMDKKRLLDILAANVSQLNMQQATNEVMFNPEVGTDWGDEADEYLGVVDAALARLEEIQEHNQKLDEAGEDHGQIDPSEDEVMTRLSGQQEQFNAEVQERHEELMENVRAELAVHTTDYLREQAIEKRIEQECDMAWFEEYKAYQVYYACRFPNNHDKLYFSSVNGLLGLPPSLRSQIFDEFDKIDLTGSDTKNLLTSLSS